MVLDCVTSLKHGADLLWIETEKPNVAQIAGMVNEVRKHVPDAKLVTTIPLRLTGRWRSESRSTANGRLKART